MEVILEHEIQLDLSLNVFSYRKGFLFDRMFVVVEVEIENFKNIGILLKSC